MSAILSQAVKTQENTSSDRPTRSLKDLSPRWNCGKNASEGSCKFLMSSAKNLTLKRSKRFPGRPGKRNLAMTNSPK